MELFGILLAFPLSLVLSAMFCVIAAAALEEWATLRQVVVVLSICVLLSGVVELWLCSRSGAAWLYDNWGQKYTWMHSLNFFLTPPSVANLIIVAFLRAETPEWVLNTFSTAACWVVSIAVLFGHITAQEAIYGVDGAGRPQTVDVTRAN